MWIPNKEKCPRHMAVEERQRLLEMSTPIDPSDPRSRRFALRGEAGCVEVFDVKWGRDVEGEPEFHGHPASRVDRGVLKSWRADGRISPSEYNRLRRELPGC